MVIKVSSLEEELKRLKSSTVYKHNNDLLYGHAIKTELDSERKNIRQELSVNSISKTYDKRKVVNRVSLQLNKGEAVGLLGPNGAGKTTNHRSFSSTSRIQYWCAYY
mgnify:CR=1 FL=1